MNQSVNQSSNHTFTQSQATAQQYSDTLHTHTHNARYSTKLKCISVKASTNGVKVLHVHGSWDKRNTNLLVFTCIVPVNNNTNTACGLFSIYPKQFKQSTATRNVNESFYVLLWCDIRPTLFSRRFWDLSMFIIESFSDSSLRWGLCDTAKFMCNGKPCKVKARSNGIRTTQIMHNRKKKFLKDYNAQPR